MPGTVQSGAVGRLSVMVLIDWQNTYNGAREAFNLGADRPIAGNIDPWKLALLLGVAKDPTGDERGLFEARVYRGAPSPTRDPKTYSAFRSQTAAWKRDGGGRLVLRTRALRYPSPHLVNVRPREKGVDVMLAIDLVEAAIKETVDRVVVVSTDTDLAPALELAVATRGEHFVEVAGWDGPGESAELLTVRGHRIKQWRLRRQVYERLADHTDYTRPKAERANWDEQIAVEGKRPRS